MRAFVYLSICLLACPVGVLAEDWCAPDSSYETGHQANVANLRWSLYSLSELNKVKAVSLDTRRRLADGSLFSLANIYILRALFTQRCKIGENTYYQEMADNQRFITLFLGVTSSPTFESVPLIAKNRPELVLTGPALSIVRGRPFPPIDDKEITTRIEGRIKEAGNNRKSPLWIAGSQLLGEEIRVNEGEIDISSIDRFKMNPKDLGSDVPLAEAFGLLRKPDWASNLKVLADYYAPR